MSDKYQIANTKDQTAHRFDLEERTVQFSKQIISFCRNVKQDSISKPLISQLVRAASSIGANYHEANNASSRTDFRNKLYIAKKEAQETGYWLELLSSVSDNAELTKLQSEAYELVKILQSIVKKVEA
jgi:four helix bundle protein